MPIGALDYVPIVKAKQAEIKALLKAPPALHVMPVFELQRAAVPYLDPKTGTWKNVKSEATDAGTFLDHIAVIWSDPFYLDISRVASPSNRQRWWTLISALNGVNAVPAPIVPVLTVEDDAASRAAAMRASPTGEVAIRVDMTQPSVSVSLTSAGLTPQLLTPELSLSSSSVVDVILDWKSLAHSSPPLDHLETQTILVIGGLGGQHGRLITAGTPADGAFVRSGDWSVTRREWWLWLRLMQGGLDVVYGDYALYPPGDPVPAGPQYGHLRYSSGSELHVVRRAIPPTGGGLGAAFTECCSGLVTYPCWLGSTYSAADGRIADIAAGNDKESSAGKWREIAATHHFAHVATQLASPPTAPAPGTP